MDVGREKRVLIVRYAPHGRCMAVTMQTGNVEESKNTLELIFFHGKPIIRTYGLKQCIGTGNKSDKACSTVTCFFSLSVHGKTQNQ